VDSAKAELLDLHDRFCQGFADRRSDVVLETVADTADLVVVTSEDAILKGITELEAFLERYTGGSTTYSWTWDRRDAAVFDTWGSLLAIGTETANDESGQNSVPYRMTLVAKRLNDGWELIQVHGSSPHQEG
jgi:hypothetical protein